MKKKKKKKRSQTGKLVPRPNLPIEWKWETLAEMPCARPGLALALWR